MYKNDIIRLGQTPQESIEKYEKLKDWLESGTMDADYFKSWNQGYLQQMEQSKDVLERMMVEAKHECTRWTLAIDEKQKELQVLRPNTKKDAAERINIIENFAKSIREIDPTGSLDLRFHATKFIATKDIIESGGIISSCDRLDGYMTSSDAPNIISASDINHVQDSINFWLDIKSETQSLPAGCMFVVQPQTREEADMISSREMHNVMFKKNPEQLVAILTTSENKAQVQQWMNENGLNSNIVFTFEEFPARLDYMKDDLIPPYEESNNFILGGIADEVLNGEFEGCNAEAEMINEQSYRMHNMDEMSL